MPESVLLVVLYFSYFLSIICAVVGPYASSYLAWVKYAQDCRDVFAKQGNLDILPLIVKNYKYKCLLNFIFFHILINYVSFIVFIWLLNMEVEINNISKLLFIPLIIIFLISHILLYFSVKILFKKFNKIGVYTTAEAISNFKIYQEKLGSNLQVSEFKLYKFAKIAMRNQPFQFNQWRYKGKIRRLKNKKYNEEKYNIKLLNMYIRYLKTYAIFFKRMQVNLRDFIDDYSVIINNQKHESLEPLKDVLINNFFAYANAKS